jgi:hypothetical protein
MNKTKRVELVIDEATGKQVRRLVLEEPYPESREVYIAIEFEDGTEILIEVDCRPFFDIRHLARNADGELEPVKKAIHGPIRSIAGAKQ